MKSAAIRNQRAQPITSYRAARQDFFRHSSPRLLLALVTSSLLIRASFGAPSFSDFVTVSTLIATWPLLEWGLHRYALNLKPLFGHEFEFAKKHRQHHEKPWITPLTLLPVQVHFTLAPILVAFGVWLLPEAKLAFSGMAALAAITLFYEWIHYLVYTRIQPTSNYAKRVFRNHRLHHFRNEHYWLSFTAPALDTAFGTGPDAKTTRQPAQCAERSSKQNK